jgi:hypothetical protein
MIKRLFILTLLTASFSFNGLAQMSVGYMPFESIISISTNTDRLIWGELRIQSNTFFGNVVTEPSLRWNFKRQNQANYYVGAGVSVNPFNPVQDLELIEGYAIAFGSRIKPIVKYPKIQLIFEISPYYNRYFDGGTLKSHLGVAYQF